MVSDQEIVNGVESLLRQSNPNAVTSINGLVQQLEAKLGLDLSHKAGFIRDLLGGGGGGGGGGSGGGGGAFGGGGGVRSPPPNPQPSPPSVQPKDLFTLQHFPQFHSSTAQHFPSHFALPHHHHHQQQQQHNHHNHHHHHHLEEFNFRYPQQQQQPQQQLYPYPHQHLHPQQRQHPIPHPNPNAHPQHQQQRIDGSFVSTISEAGTTEIKKGSAPAGTKRRGGPGGLNKVCGVSPELEAVVGEPALPRTQIVKQLWAYIRKHNLQDPSNKRKIICDDALRLLFETDCTDMFKMNKLLSKHIRPLQPTKEPGPDSKRLKTETESTIESTEASAEVSAEASTEASPEAASDTGSATVIISDALANFFETEEREMPQSEAVRRVWEHIKINQLEDQQNPMMIVCDSKLQELFGCENISALEIAEMLMTNFVKQL